MKDGLPTHKAESCYRPPEVQGDRNVHEKGTFNRNEILKRICMTKCLTSVMLKALFHIASAHHFN